MGNMYTTREMIDGISVMVPMERFLSKTFFSMTKTHVAEKIEFDIRKGRRKMAPFVAPRVGGKIILRDGYKTNTFTTPKISPERIITIDDINLRGFGENLYSKMTPEERATNLLAQDIRELEETIQNRKEWMVRQILLEGKIDIQNPDEGLDVSIDFGFSNRLILADGALWSRDTSDPIADLKMMRRAIIKETGVAPNMVLVATNVADVFVKHSKLLTSFLNLKNVIVEPRVVSNAITFLGRVQEIDMDIYSYDEWFIDDFGDEQPVLPPGAVLVANSNGIGTIHYGAVTQTEDGGFVTYESELVPKMWTDNENDIKKLRLTSRPIPVPDNVDSWYVATVL